MIEYKLRVVSQNPIIISQQQFDACKNKDGSLKFGNVNEVVNFGAVGVNLKDVRGWETIKLDPMPRGFEDGQTEINQEGIRKLRLLHAAFDRKNIHLLGKDEQAEVAGIIRDHETRKASAEYAKRSLFNSLHFDVFYKDESTRESAYQHWVKSSDALIAADAELNKAANELFLEPVVEPEIEPAQLSSGEEEVQRVKAILTEMSPDKEDELILPF